MSETRHEKQTNSTLELSRQQRLIVEALRNSPTKSCTNSQLNNIAFRYGARIWELNHNKGFIITCHVLKAGLFEYCLESDPGTQPVQESLFEMGKAM